VRPGITVWVNLTDSCIPRDASPTGGTLCVEAAGFKGWTHWLESHFRWQIRTFWFGFLWISLCVLFIIATLGIGLIVAWLPMAVVALWFIYRIVSGWLALRDNRPMYA
jgi:uncharacterized membrane protein